MAKYNLENLQDIVKIEPNEITDIFGENKGSNINFEEELEKRGGKYIISSVSSLFSLPTGLTMIGCIIPYSFIDATKTSHFSPSIL